MPRAAARRSPAGRKRGTYTQAQRALTLYDQLLQGGTVRIASAAADLGVSERQIQRDMAVVRSVLGARLEQRDDGGWHLAR